MKKKLLALITVIISFYILICGLLYFSQEKILFVPEKLPEDFKFNFPQKFEEINIRVNDGKILNGLLFKVKKSKGLLFYLHGSGGSLRTWGDVAKTYTKMQYDIFMLDFRSYGKSEGEITSEKQLFQDDQTVYNYFRKRYAENKIIILGYSLGTGLAAKLASENNPKLLILQAPYYNLTDMMNRQYKILPPFILRYKLATNAYIRKCKMPVIIYHGTNDQTIYYGSSLKLKREFKNSDTLITLKGEGHEKITDNLQYQSSLEKILNR